MADIIYSYAYDESKQKNKDNEEPKCKLYPVYPCIVTHNTCIICCDSCEQERGNSCDYCIGICFPITLTFDIITLIPYTIIYSINKCFEKN